MRIDYRNKEEIDKLYLHDSEFEGFCYDYEKRQITLSCDNYFKEFRKRTVFTFHNVIFYSIQSCEFWGKCFRIYEIYLQDDSTEMDQLLKSKLAGDYKHSYLDKGVEYLPIEIGIISGDILVIICESVDVHEEELCLPE